MHARTHIFSKCRLYFQLAVLQHLLLGLEFFFTHRVPAAKEGRDSIEFDVFGMQGIPPEYLAERAAKKMRGEDPAAGAAAAGAGQGMMPGMMPGMTPGMPYPGMGYPPGAPGYPPGAYPGAPPPGYG